MKSKYRQYVQYEIALLFTCLIFWNNRFARAEIVSRNIPGVQKTLYIHSTISARHLLPSNFRNKLTWVSTIVKSGRRGRHAVRRSTVRARNVLRTLSCYRCELRVRRKSARPLALVTSGQVVSHRRYSRQVLVSMPNFRFVRPFLVAFYRSDPFNSTCSPTDVSRDYRDRW